MLWILSPTIMKQTLTIFLRSTPRSLLAVAMPLLLIPAVAGAAEAAGHIALGEPPKLTREFLQTHCYDCHTGDQAEAGLDLPTLLKSDGNLPTMLGSDDAALTWVRIHDRVADGEMPPPDAAELSSAEIEPFRAATAQWIQRYQTQVAELFGASEPAG